MTAEREIELKPCPFCGGRDIVVPITRGTYARCSTCEAEGPYAKKPTDGIAAWNRRSPPERDGEETLNRYRYAAQWAAADSWDGCGDCRQRLQWAMELDDNRLDANSLAAVGKIFLAQTGRALAKHSPESK